MVVAVDTKGMRCIINYFEPISVGDGLNAVGVAWNTVAMHRHNRGGARCNGSLYLFRIHAAGILFNVYKHRVAPIPPNGVSGGDKTIGGCDNLAGNVQCL